MFRYIFFVFTTNSVLAMKSTSLWQNLPLRCSIVLRVIKGGSAPATTLRRFTSDTAHFCVHHSTYISNQNFSYTLKSTKTVFPDYIHTIFINMLSLRAILRQANSNVCAFTVYESLLFSYFLEFCFIYVWKKIIMKIKTL